MRAMRASGPAQADTKRPAPSGRFAICLTAACVFSNTAIASDDDGAAPWQVYRDANPFVGASGLPRVCRPNSGCAACTFFRRSYNGCAFAGALQARHAWRHQNLAAAAPLAPFSGAPTTACAFAGALQARSVFGVAGYI
jgi:hypothetical protein